MRFGTLLRFLFVAGWAVFLSIHITHHAAPGLGLTERNAFSTALAKNLGRTYVYHLQRSSTNAPQKIGECTTSYLRTENGFELETTLHVDDLGVLAPSLNLLPALRNASSRQMHLRLTEVLSNERFLIGLRGSGNLLGLEAEGDGLVNDTGLHGTYILEDGAPTPFHVPTITSAAANGNDFAVTLPPGLQIGDRFTSQLLSPDITALKLKTITAIYTVLPKETLTTVAGQLSVFRVQMEVDNRKVATLWCDDQGTVFLSRQKDGMELSLATIREIGGNILWPPALVTKP